MEPAIPPTVQHRSNAPESVRCVVITVSDTRTSESDTGGPAIQESLRAAGYEVAACHLVRDEPAPLGALLEKYTWDPGIDAVITTGGTGISPRDTTYETVSRMLDKQLPGFGELFRLLSFQEEHVGTAAMLSRATAGVARNTIVIALPGSPGAVKLAMERLVIPELTHMVGQVRRRT